MKAFSLIPLCLMTAPLHAGWAGNGGEISRDQNNVWFLGDKPVEYCIESHRNFGFTENELKSLIEESLAEWQLFFHRYQLDQSQFGTGSTFNPQFPDFRPRKISLRFQAKAHCFKPEQELIFAFGTTPSVVKHHIEQVPSEMGAAIRSEYNHKSYRSGGYVWIAPAIKYTESDGKEARKSWTDARPLLKHILLHELGHVFGMIHESTPVMSKSIGDEIVKAAQYSHLMHQYGSIETATFHYQWRVGDTIELCADRRYNGSFGMPDRTCSNHELPPDVRNYYHLSPNKVHRRFLKITGNDTMTLVVEPLDDNEAKFSFAIKGSPYATLTGMYYGPSLYSQWRSDNHLFWNTGYLDFGSSLLPVKGSITIFGEKRALLIDRTTTMSIFDAKTGTWHQMSAF